MECMCAQNEPRFILSSEKKRCGRMESEPMLTPRAKIPSTGSLREASNPRRCTTQDNEPNTLPTELYFGPKHCLSYWDDSTRHRSPNLEADILSFGQSLLEFAGPRCGVTVSTSAFLVCYCDGSRLVCGLNLRALVCGIF